MSMKVSRIITAKNLIRNTWKNYEVTVMSGFAPHPEMHSDCTMLTTKKYTSSNGQDPVVFWYST